MLKYSQFLYFLKSSRFLKIAAKAFEAGNFLNIFLTCWSFWGSFSHKNFSYKKNVYLLYYLFKKKKKKMKRSAWVKPWLGRKINPGLSEKLVLRFEDESEYKKLLSMTPQDFDEILGLIQDDIIKTNTNMRDSIPANTKLAATVRLLFTNIFVHKYKYSKSCFHSFML